MTSSGPLKIFTFAIPLKKVGLSSNYFQIRLSAFQKNSGQSQGCGSVLVTGKAFSLVTTH